MVVGPDDPRWPRLRALFAELFELEPARRAAELTRIAREDGELAAELGRLLEGVEEGEGYLAPPGWARRIGVWRLEGELAGGPPGRRYRARHAGSGREAVLRVVPLGERPLATVARLRELAPRLARFEHPAFARALEIGLCTASEDRLPALYLASERVQPSRSLHAAVSDASTPTGQRARLLAQACAALADLHEHDLVHGYLGPSNLQLEPGGGVRVLDLGLGLLFPSCGRVPEPRDDVLALAAALQRAFEAAGPALEPVRGFLRAPAVGERTPTAAEMAAALRGLASS